MARGRLSGSQLKKKHPRVEALRKKRRKPGGLRTAAGRGKRLAPPAVVESRKERKDKKHPGRSKPISIRRKKGTVTRQSVKPKSTFTKRKFEQKPEMPPDAILIEFARRRGIRVITDTYCERITHDDLHGTPASEQRRHIAEEMRRGLEAREPSRPARKSFDDLPTHTQLRIVREKCRWTQVWGDDKVKRMIDSGTEPDLNDIKRRWNAGEINL